MTEPEDKLDPANIPEFDRVLRGLAGVDPQVLDDQLQEMERSIPVAPIDGEYERPGPSLSYAQEKFGNAVHILATTDHRTLRLKQAFREIIPISVDDLPEQVRADFQWICTKLTSKKWDYPDEVPAPSRVSPIDATLHGMHGTTAEKIAKRICNIEAFIRDL